MTTVQNYISFEMKEKMAAAFLVIQNQMFERKYAAVLALIADSVNTDELRKWMNEEIEWMGMSAGDLAIWAVHDASAAPNEYDAVTSDFLEAEMEMRPALRQKKSRSTFTLYMGRRLASMDKQENEHFDSVEIDALEQIMHLHNIQGISVDTMRGAIDSYQCWDFPSHYQRMKTAQCLRRQELHAALHAVESQPTRFRGRLQAISF